MSADGHAELGVSKLEAFNKVLYQSGSSGKVILWLLGISIGLTMFAYALDQGITTAIFTTMASSTFGQHSSLAAVRYVITAFLTYLSRVAQSVH